MRRQQQLALSAAFWGILKSSNTNRLCQRIQFLGRNSTFSHSLYPAHYSWYIPMTQRSPQTCQHRPEQATAASPSIHLEQSFWQHFCQGWKKSGIQPVCLPHCLTKRKWRAEHQRWARGCMASLLVVFLRWTNCKEIIICHQVLVTGVIAAFSPDAFTIHIFNILSPTHGEMLEAITAWPGRIQSGLDWTKL